MLRTTLRRRRGLSLLELLVTMILLTIVLITFAAVYPSGYRLNRKSAKATVAAQTATAIIDEIQNLPLTNEGGGLSLTLLADIPWTSDAAEYENFPATEIPSDFFLEDTTGIVVTSYDLNTSGAPTDLSVFASIQVTVAYREPETRGDELTRVTVTASKTWNR